MNDEMVQAVLHQAPDRSLAELEADVWAGVAASAQARRTQALVAGGQLTLMTVALLGSLSLGSAAVAAKAREHSSFALLSSADLAPSTLLVER